MWIICVFSFALRRMKPLSRRAMDLVESDIRQTPGNEKFQLDGCMIRVDAGVSVEAGMQTYFIRRRFSYENVEK